MLNSLDREDIGHGFLFFVMGLLSVPLGLAFPSRPEAMLLIVLGGFFLAVGAAILAFKLCFRSDGQDIIGSWHGAQLVLALILILALAGLGTSGLAISSAALSFCPSKVDRICSLLQWPAYIVSAIYGLVMIVLAPGIITWDWFGAQRHFRELQLKVLIDLQARQPKQQ